MRHAGVAPFPHIQHASYPLSSTGLLPSGPVGTAVGLTERVVVPADIGQVKGHCWLLMFARHPPIGSQENENCRGHSGSIETHLGISTCTCEPSPLPGCQDTLNKSPLLPTEEAQGDIHGHTESSIESGGRKIPFGYWASHLFLRLFNSTAAFLFQPVFLYMSRKITQRHHCW